MSDQAREALSKPVLGLKITVVIGVVYVLGSLIAGFIFPEMNQMPEGLEWLNALGYVTTVTALAGAAFLWVVAGKMQRLESYTLCLVGSIVAIFPMVSPCCCLTLPIGIWCLILLAKPEVKEAFSS